LANRSIGEREYPVVAAAIADPLVEFASNAGFFGPDALTDHSSVDILPALLVGGAFVFGQVLLRARTALTSQLRAASDSLTSISLLAMLPAIFSIQISVLFGMETLEQFVVYGHGLGGSIWLGGPIAVSVAVHALFCIASTLLVAKSLRAMTHTVVRLVRIFRELITVRARVTTPLLRALHDLVAIRTLAPIACRIGERAPPLA
jgi:hypothetical protein